MVDRFYGYQYDTNPRKLSPEHIPYKNRYPTKEDYMPEYRRKQIENMKKVTKKQLEKAENNRVERKVRKSNDNASVDDNTKNSKKAKVNVKGRLRIVMFVVASFSVLFAISYQNSLISESFNKKEQYKKEMEALSKTNQQIEVGIENNLNLNNIEQAAKEKIGMQKLNNNQKIYVSLPKEDYVAPAGEEIVIEEDLGFFQKLVRGFTKSVR